MFKVLRRNNRITVGMALLFWEETKCLNRWALIHTSVPRHPVHPSAVNSCPSSSQLKAALPLSCAQNMLASVPLVCKISWQAGLEASITEFIEPFGQIARAGGVSGYYTKTRSSLPSLGNVIFFQWKEEVQQTHERVGSRHDPSNPRHCNLYDAVGILRENHLRTLYI